MKDLVFDLIKQEKTRQSEGLELIPSENYVSKAVLEAMGLILTNKYSEGYPNLRAYLVGTRPKLLKKFCPTTATTAAKPTSIASNVSRLIVLVVYSTPTTPMSNPTPAPKPTTPSILPG